MAGAFPNLDLYARYSKAAADASTNSNAGKEAVADAKRRDALQASLGHGNPPPKKKGGRRSRKQRKSRKPSRKGRKSSKRRR